MGQYLPIFAMLVLAIVFAGVSRVVSQLLAPRRPSEAKASPYGALDWGPVKRLRRSDIVSPARTATTTIRRVGLEGRSTGEAA